MKTLLVTLSFILFSYALFSQITGVYQQSSISYAASSGVSVPSFAYQESLVFGKNKTIWVGTGLRLSSFSSKNTTFIKDNQSITIRDKAQATVLSIPVHFEARLKGFFVGANIDVIGITFGKQRDSVSKTANFNKLDSAFTAKPVAFSSILGRRGTISSQVYVGVLVSREFSIRFGVSFVSSQFSTNYYDLRRKTNIDYDKFRYNTQAMPFISLVFTMEK